MFLSYGQLIICTKLVFCNRSTTGEEVQLRCENSVDSLAPRGMNKKCIFTTRRPCLRVSTYRTVETACSQLNVAFAEHVSVLVLNKCKKNCGFIKTCKAHN